MSTDLQLLSEKIISHPYFQKTKLVTENNECHDHQIVYDHLLLTAERIKKAAIGDFITDPKAKNLFKEWMETDKFGMKYEDIAVVTALLHDIGKIFVYEKGGENRSIVEMQKNGNTLALGHEYLGSTLIAEIASDIGLSKEIGAYIAQIIRFHGTLIFAEFDRSKTVLEMISEMKVQAEGLYREVLFNTYGDVLSCPIFQDWIHMIEQMMNHAEFYKTREYIVG